MTATQQRMDDLAEVIRMMREGASLDDVSVIADRLTAASAAVPDDQELDAAARLAEAIVGVFETHASPEAREQFATAWTFAQIVFNSS
jgi:hypothetical protein